MSEKEPSRAKRWRRYQPPTTDEIEREPSSAAAPSAPAPPPAPPRRSGRAWVWLAVAVIVGAGLLLGLLRNGGVLDAAPDPAPRETHREPLLTAKGLAALAAALQQETGGTDVLEVWLESDGTARLTAPPETPDDLAEMYWWEDGVLEKWSAEKAGDRVPFDLGVLRPGVLTALDDEARERSDGRISSSRSKVERPLADTDHWIYVTVDEVDHGGVTLWADLEGHVESDLVNKSWRDD